MEPSPEQEAKRLLDQLANDHPYYETADVIIAARRLRDVLFPPDKEKRSKPPEIEDIDIHVRWLVKSLKHFDVRLSAQREHRSHVLGCFEHYDTCMRACPSRDCALSLIVSLLPELVPIERWLQR
jgi:hypothetical protein